jgi:cobyrinic acid a,c-diamide synthase
MTAGFIVAAPRSGSGKTTVTLALLAALRRRGLDIRAAKSGPDYIDPAFHEAATGRPGVNLDSWAMPPSLLDAIAGWTAGDGELLVIESSMGLFDGVGSTPGRHGNGADLAARWGLPVVLVLDCSGQSQSAAAVARGFALHDRQVRIAGVVLNRIASARHRDGVATAMAAAGIPVLGCVMRDPEIGLPERHLGLVQASEHTALATFLSKLADMAEQSLDLDRIIACGSPLARLEAMGPALTPPGQRIALARDEAFSFIYAHMLQGWRQAGAEIVAFSPVADEPPPDDCDACWLPGGYPELHAGRLAAASRFRSGLRHFSRDRPVHGECGGFMVLGTALEDADGATHEMTGLLGHATSFARRRLNLGYREATLLQAGPGGPAGRVWRGHEFHYASVTAQGDDTPFASLRDGLGRDLGPAGGRRGMVSGSFFHLIAPAETGSE